MPGHSVFKQEFLDLIQGKAKDPFPDGYITGEELGAHLATKVPEYNNGAQHPQHGKIMDPQLNKGNFVFVLPGPAVKPPIGSRETPPPPTGSIFVASQPAGAQVLLAGILQARRTPVRIQDVMAGTHMLKLTLEDYADYTQQITIQAGREVQVNPTLRRKGRSKWPFILGGVIVASGAGVAAYILTDGFNNGNGPVDPPPGDLTISINIP